MNRKLTHGFTGAHAQYHPSNVSMAQSMPLYDRLMARYVAERQLTFDLLIESARFNTFLRQLGNDPAAVYIRNVVDALIYHHKLLDGGLHMHGVIPYRGKPITKNSNGIIYDMRDYPTILNQLLVRFFREIVDGTCPEMEK